MANRKGIGKARHIDVSYLWIQDKLALGKMSLVKVLGTENPADIFTKTVVRDLVDRYTDIFGMRYLAGRAGSAPKL